MTAAHHIDLVALDRDIARSGIHVLLELLEEDPVAIAMHCPGCGVTSLVPDGIERTSGKPFADVWLILHADCGAGGRVK